jgi:hypothetical protein
MSKILALVNEWSLEAVIIVALAKELQLVAKTINIANHFSLFHKFPFSLKLENSQIAL